jgi:hypothetical protein
VLSVFVSAFAVSFELLLQDANAMNEKKMMLYINFICL